MNISNLFSECHGTIEKLRLGVLRVSRGSASASVRLFTRQSGFPLGPGDTPPCDFSTLPAILKKSRYPQKSPRLQTNPSYQPKKYHYLNSKLRLALYQQSGIRHFKKGKFEVSKKDCFLIYAKQVLVE